jgi:phosphonate transport system permease protein
MVNTPSPSNIAPARWKSGQRGLIGAIIIAVYIIAFWQTDTDPVMLFLGLPDMVKFFGSMFPPHFFGWDQPYFYNKESEFQYVLLAALETFQMAVLGTVIAVVFGFVLAMLAARNITPNVFIYHGVRTLCDGFRGISEVVWALLFVAMVGLGPFTGVLALAVHNTGALGKFFSEAIEAMDEGILESVEASGATRTQVFFHGIIPELGTLFMSYILYYFEHNLRQAMVLGIVGAGGIGIELLLAMKYFNFNKALSVIIIMLVMVVITDRLSGMIRKRLVGGELVVVT